MTVLDLMMDFGAEGGYFRLLRPFGWVTCEMAGYKVASGPSDDHPAHYLYIENSIEPRYFTKTDIQDTNSSLLSTSPCRYLGAYTTSGTPSAMKSAASDTSPRKSSTGTNTRISTGITMETTTIRSSEGEAPTPSAHSRATTTGTDISDETGPLKGGQVDAEGF